MSNAANDNGSQHTAVLVEETMHVLDVKAGGRYLDGTLGGGTHSMELLKRSSPDGRVVSLDVDRSALERAKAQFASYGDRWQGVETNFRFLDTAARDAGVEPLDGILLDLGFSSDELADPTKGLSFLVNGPLDMRLGPKANEDGLTAADIVNSWPVGDIERVLREYGEERFSRRIAEEIVRARKSSRIIGTLDFVAVIKKALPATYERGRIHPATRSFQALRIAVNDELNTLQKAIKAAHEVLSPGGRLAIITFHSLEDRIVKNAFKSEDGWEPVVKKPILPQEDEIENNPRSRSAKLRAAKKGVA